LDERIADFLKPVAGVEAIPQSYEEIVNKLRRLMEMNERQYSIPVLNFTGAIRTGKRDVAAKLCEALGVKLYTLNLKTLHSSGLQIHDIVPIIERECMLL